MKRSQDYREPRPPGYTDVIVLLSMTSGDISEKDRKTVRARILGSLT